MNILPGPEETPFYPKELSNKAYVNIFQQVLLDTDNGLVFYYKTPCRVRVSQLRIIVVPVKFR